MVRLDIELLERQVIVGFKSSIGQIRKKLDELEKMAEKLEKVFKAIKK